MGEMAAFRLLGPVEARIGGQLADVGHARQRCVLAVLLLDANRFVSADQLVDRVWGNGPFPQRPRNALQTYVSLLRRALAASRELAIARQSNGYMIRIDEQLVDVYEFRTLLRKARAADNDDEAATLFERAIGLWRGEALGILDTPWIGDVRANLEKERQAAERDLTDIQLRQGQHAALLADLSRWADLHPLDERLAAQLVLALYRSGRQADALSHYQHVRGRLADELGIDASPVLQQLHLQILTADPALTAPVTSPASRPAGSLVLRSALAARYSLPPDTAVFTGRDDELSLVTARVTRAAGAGGLVVIGGMPGIGKTTLAVHVAHLLRDRFPDQQLFIDLHAHTPGRDPVSATTALAGLLTAVGLETRYLPEDAESRAGLWRHRMAGQRALLVLDNAASSAQVARLLPGGTSCLVLVTSRRHLGDLPGAVVPVLLDALPADQAREMFLRLAPRAAESAAVQELAGLTGGLPLAISLLARVYARHPSWTLTDLAAETRASLLTLAAENDNVAAAFDVSYQDLPPGQRQFFRRLSLHPGTTFDAYAAAALTGVAPAEAAGYLDALHGEGLLTEVGYRRYGMHDLIRSYARERAAADPAADLNQGLDRLLDYYQHTAVLTQARLARQTRTRPGLAASTELPTAVPDLPDQQRSLSWARAERGNLLACLDHATRGGQDVRVVTLTAGIAALLRQDGPWTYAVTRHTRAVQAARHLGDRLGQADALNDLGVVRRLSGDYPNAARAVEEALRIYRDLDDRQGQANALNELGIVRYQTGDSRGAARALEEALGIYRDLGDRHGQANALSDLGAVRLLTGDYAGAVDAQRAALDIYRDLGDRQGQANTLNELGAVLRQTGNYSGAAQAVEEALRMFRDLGDRLGRAHSFNYLGAVRRRAGDYRGAAEALEAALSLHKDLGDRQGWANARYELGAVLRQTGDYAGAAQAVEEALRMFRDLGNRGGEAEALNEAGTLHRVRGDLDRAEASHRQALDLAREIDSSWDEAHALAGLGRCALEAGRMASAKADLRQAREIFERIGAAEAGDVAAELDALTICSQRSGQHPGNERAPDNVELAQ
jgi:DNA-binding SARP family transcriptional activator/tetratricopeptide (TPR) repeat protein